MKNHIADTGQSATRTDGRAHYRDSALAEAADAFAAAGGAAAVEEAVVYAQGESEGAASGYSQAVDNVACRAEDGPYSTRGHTNGDAASRSSCASYRAFEFSGTRGSSTSRASYFPSRHRTDSSRSHYSGASRKTRASFWSANTRFDGSKRPFSSPDYGLFVTRPTTVSYAQSYVLIND